MPQPPRRRPRPRPWTAHSPVGDVGVVLLVFSAADLLLTHWLLLEGGGRFVEANPLARWAFDLGNIRGMIAFKFGLVALIVVLGEVIERHRPGWGRAVILFGALAAGVAFTHGLRLWFAHG